MTFLFYLLLPFIGTLPPPTNLIDTPTFKNKYGKETIETVNGIGQIQLNGTKVTEHLSIQGSLISNNAEIHHLTVMGEANLRDTTVHEIGEFMGYLQAHKTTFTHNIQLTSQKAIFTASKIKGITFKGDGSYKGKQFLELKQGTIVDGPVTFEGGKGEIYLYSGSKILGPITGGKKIYKN